MISKRSATILIFLIGMAVLLLFAFKSSDAMTSGDVTVVLGVVALAVVGTAALVAAFRKAIRGKKGKSA